MSPVEGVTFAQIAAQLGVELCTGCDQYRHDRYGELRWTEHGRVIHWAERMVTVQGLRKFLMKVALVKRPELEHGDLWWRIWQQNVTADAYGRQLHHRFPRRLADVDRARVRFLLHEVPDWKLRHWDDDTRNAYRRATRWAYPH